MTYSGIPLAVDHDSFSKGADSLYFTNIDSKAVFTFHLEFLFAGVVDSDHGRRMTFLNVPKHLSNNLQLNQQIWA
jgi:hypothetical protein